MANKGTCKATDCNREVIAKGYCRKHYRLWKAGEMPKARYKTCTFEKCRKHALSRQPVRGTFQGRARRCAGAAAATPPVSAAPPAEPAASA